MRRSELLTLTRIRAACKTGDARRHRVAAGLSLPEVAAATGVAHTTILRWERGERRPSGPAALRYGALIDALRRETTAGAA